MIDLKPIITETSIANGQKGWFTFKAAILKNKNSLREQIEKVFKVNVVEIKTMVVKGKTKRSLRNRKITKGQDWKKILVKLKTGQKIDIFDIGN